MFSANIGSSASAFTEARESVDIFSAPADNWRATQARSTRTHCYRSLGFGCVIWIERRLYSKV